MVMNVGLCTVCRSNIKVTEVSVLTCGHAFHYRCVIPWIQQSHTCPNCRRLTYARDVVRRVFFLPPSGSDETSSHDSDRDTSPPIDALDEGSAQNNEEVVSSESAAPMQQVVAYVRPSFSPSPTIWRWDGRTPHPSEHSFSNQYNQWIERLVGMETTVETSEGRRQPSERLDSFSGARIAVPLQPLSSSLQPITHPAEEHEDQNEVEGNNDWLVESVGNSEDATSNLYSDDDDEVIVLSSDDESSVRELPSANGDDGLALLYSSPSNSSYPVARRPSCRRLRFGSPFQPSSLFPPPLSPSYLFPTSRGSSPLSSEHSLTSHDYSSTSSDYSHSPRSLSPSLSWSDEVSDGDGWSAVPGDSLPLESEGDIQHNNGTASQSSAHFCTNEDSVVVVSPVVASTVQQGQRTSSSHVSTSNTTSSLIRPNSMRFLYRVLKREFDSRKPDSVYAPKRTKFS